MTELEVNLTNFANGAEALGGSRRGDETDGGSHLSADGIRDAPPSGDSGQPQQQEVVATWSVQLEEEQPAATASLQQRKRKHRRGKSNRKRKVKRWKPYNERTWAEKRELDERETRRAESNRAERWAHGQAVAPYNTTSFLMEDEDHRSANKEEEAAVGGDCSSAEEDTEAAEMDFLQREFSAVYDSLHAERIGAMTKHQLVQEYLFLEDRVEKLEMALGAARSVAAPPLWQQLPPPPIGPTQPPNRPTQLPQEDGRKEDGVAAGTVAGGGAKTWSAEQAQKVRIFQREIRKLASENSKLRRENDILRTLRDRSRTAAALTNGDDDDDDDEEEGDGHRSSDDGDAVCLGEARHS